MPTEEQKTVDIDTSGPGAEINVEEKKDESVVETEAPKQEEVEKVETKQEEVKEETREELKEGSEPEEKKDEEKLEDYSKGVQARIAKLTRKMREAERREKLWDKCKCCMDSKTSHFKSTPSLLPKKIRSIM